MFFCCRRLAPVLFAATLFASVAAQTPIRRIGHVQRIFVFGDSLSDSGNVFAMTFGLYPSSPYWQGRFSNGPTWAERLGAMFGLTIRASRTGGTNYAHGGAETGSGFSSAGTPNLDRQISSFVSNSGTFGANDLVVLWIGGNDLLNGQTNVSIPTTNIYNHCVRLRGLGARQMIIANLPLLGFTPRYRGTANELTMNDRSQQFNVALQARIAEFRLQSPALYILSFNVEQAFDMVLSNPGTYGFSNVTQSYMDFGSGSADAYAFWDDIHPTRAVHSLLGTWAFQQLRALFVMPSVASAERALSL